MNAVTVNINLKNAKGTFNLEGQKVRFSSNCCFAFDNGDDDKKCFEAIGKHLLTKESELAVYSNGKFFKELVKYVPELKSRIQYVIQDNPDLGDSKTFGIPVIPPEKLPPSVKTVFLCETLMFPRMRMRKNLRLDIKILSPDILVEINKKIIPKRAWVPFVDCIYPIDVPEIEFLPNQDLLLIDCPSRNLAFMPNGVSYVHNALKKTDIKFQTLDLDIIIYHRYHIYRLFDTQGEIRTPDGYEMPQDPWLTEAYEAWQKPETIEYFRAEIDEIVNAIIKARPKILGLSIQACNIRFSQEVVKGVKKALPDVLILVGGFSCYQPSIGLRAFPECDYMVIGEADLTIGALVEQLAKGLRPTGLPGVMSRFDPPDMIFQPGQMPENLDSLEFPKYEWFDLGIYRNYNHYQLTPIIASRGCRWSLCTFCAERFYWRIRSPKNVVDEFEWLAHKGCDLFMFNESDLNGKPEILLEICDEIIKRGLKIRLTGQLRIHKKCDRAFFDRLRAAGFVSLRFGVDAWSRRTLKLQLKGYTPARITQNLRDCSQAGIFTEVNTVIGVPGETEEDIDESIALMIENKPNIGRIANINPLLFVIGSVYWEDPEKYNIHFRDDRDSLYTQYATVIPSDLWYSENPYIDDKVRKTRFERVVLSLYDNGFPIGELAQQVIRDVKEGRGAEAHARPDSEVMDISAEEEESFNKGLTWPNAINNSSDDCDIGRDDLQERMHSNEQSFDQIIIYNGGYYRIKTTEDIGLEEQDFDGVLKKAGSIDVFKVASRNLFHKVFENSGKFSYYCGRALEILKQQGFRGFIKHFNHHYKRAGNSVSFALKNGAEVRITRNISNAVQLIAEGVNGYNILRLNGNVYGIKQGFEFNVDLAEADNYALGICFKGTSVKEVEELINNFSDQNKEANEPPQKLIVEDFNGYNIVEAGNNYYGIKQGFPLAISKAEAGGYGLGICFRAEEKSEIEAFITEFLATRNN